MKPRDWSDLERMAGIKRTVPPAATRRDALNLTLRRLSKSAAWRKKLR